MTRLMKVPGVRVTPRPMSLMWRTLMSPPMWDSTWEEPRLGITIFILKATLSSRQITKRGCKCYKLTTLPLHHLSLKLHTSTSTQTRTATATMGRGVTTRISLRVASLFLELSKGSMFFERRTTMESGPLLQRSLQPQIRQTRLQSSPLMGLLISPQSLFQRSLQHIIPHHLPLLHLIRQLNFPPLHQRLRPRVNPSLQLIHQPSFPHLHQRLRPRVNPSLQLIHRPSFPHLHQRLSLRLTAESTGGQRPARRRPVPGIEELTLALRSWNQK
mmetsp:Transcript_4104/g.9320  ORF Transcript_4104/g.9320 Transcript_4104/m.9320 type:complete len:272 (-) Transcript_4104:171-986(-)